MATGPEHYQAAEELLRVADDPDRTIEVRRRIDVSTALAAAQVHATLALAAATALQPARAGGVHRDRVAWHDVAAVASDDEQDSSW